MISKSTTWLFRGLIGLVSVLVLPFCGIVLYFRVIGDPPRPLFPEETPSRKTASKEDLRFIVEEGQLGRAEMIEKVLHSYTSGYTFTGDHLIAHALRLKANPVGTMSTLRWQRGDSSAWDTDPAMKHLEPILKSQREVPWFPSIEELRSQKTYIFVNKTYGTDTIQGAAVTFLQPESRTVFYFSSLR